MIFLRNTTLIAITVHTLLEDTDIYLTENHSPICLEILW